MDRSVGGASIKQCGCASTGPYSSALGRHRRAGSRGGTKINCHRLNVVRKFKIKHLHE